ncbi:MAG TPA: endonuclease III [Candidatus Limnocylindria bacterium]|nr:endonuclease III [Candidatus Limnocylindria bacterium]
MARESKSSRQGRATEIARLLREAYPDAHCELDYRNPLELLVATILSAQCTDKQVNLVTAELFQKYRSCSDYAAASEEVLAHDIRRIGLYRNKARNLIAACQAIMAKHQGKVPSNLEDLVQLAGVGRKTANVVLGNAFSMNVGIVVDTHVARLATRLGLTRETNPERIELDLMPLVPQSDWCLFSHWLIWHGRRRCNARKPDCTQCEIRALCPRVGVNLPD